MNQPDPTFPSTRVQHVAVIDLTGDYYDHRSLMDDIAEQFRFIPDGAHIRIAIGESAATVGTIRLEMQLGQRLVWFPSADIEVPGGSRWGRFIAQNVARNAREARAAQAQAG